jgi:hypothetical protein
MQNDSFGLVCGSAAFSGRRFILVDSGVGLFTSHAILTNQRPLTPTEGIID